MINSNIWKLLEQSRLESPDRVRELAEEFQRQQPPTGTVSDDQVAEWLTKNEVLTDYQATVLKAGHPGPFFYGEYRVDDRRQAAPQQGTFAAIHNPTQFRVILKFIATETTAQNWTAVASRIKQLSAVRHPGLVGIYEPVDLVQYRFSVQEDVRGKTLATLLKSRKKLSTKRACIAMFEIAQAVAALHEKGFIHGDLRPESIFVTDKTKCRVWLDPIVAPRSLEQSAQDGPEELLNRTSYLPPEMAESGRLPDVLSDVYALGCIFYQMLSGHPPFEAADAGAMMQHHATTPIASLKEAGIPPQLEKLVAFMMAKNPDLRHQNAGIIVEQVGALLTAAKSHPGETVAANRPEEEKFVEWIKHKSQSLPSASSPAEPAAPPTIQAVGTQTSGNSGADAPTTFADLAAEAESDSASPSPNLIAAESDDHRISRVRGRKNKGSRVPLIVGGIIVLLVAGIAGGWMLFGNGGDRDVADGGGGDDQTDTVDETNDGTNGSTQASNVAFEQNVVADDGAQLWETPTQGRPLDLEFVPAGIRVLIAIRLSDLENNEDGQLWLRALGPSYETAIEEWQDRIGVAPEQIEQLVIGFHDNAGGRPRASFRIRLNTPIPLATLQEAWGGEVGEPPTDTALIHWQGDQGLSFIAEKISVPSSDQEGGANVESVSLFVAADQADIDDVLATDGAPPRLRQELGQLLRYSDRDRHLSIFALPNTLFNDEGRQLFGPHSESIVEPLDELIGDGVGAVSLSAHLDNAFYLETMLKGTLDVEPSQLAEDLQSRVSQLGGSFSEFVFSLSTNPYWDRVRMKFANWMSMLSSNARYGVENRVVIANCWLPKPAAHNLTLATELALASTGGGTGPIDPAPMNPTDSVPQTIEELLQKKIDIEIPKNDLVLIVDELRETIREKYRGLPFEFDIRLMGNDLQLQGITQNLSVSDFSMLDRPIHEVLTGLLEKAYTAPGVESTHDAGFMFVWVVAPDPDAPDNTIVLLTTRVAATNASYELPEAFRIIEEDEE